MKVDFICGCQTKEILARENVKTMDAVMFDDEEFLICAIHHQRRYGWRSIPNLPGTKLMDYRFKDWTALEIEAWLVFHEPPLERKSTEITNGLVDRRDNRDPQSLVTRVTHLAIGDRVLADTPENPIFIVPRETDYRHDEMRAAFDVIDGGISGGQKVLPWRSHVRDYEDADLRERVRRIIEERNRSDEA